MAGVITPAPRKADLPQVFATAILHEQPSQIMPLLAKISLTDPKPNSGACGPKVLFRGEAVKCGYNGKIEKFTTGNITFEFFRFFGPSGDAVEQVCAPNVGCEMPIGMSPEGAVLFDHMQDWTQNKIDLHPLQELNFLK
jgi:hypothetical protein